MNTKEKKESSKGAKPKVKGWVSKTRFVESVIVDSRPAFLVKDTSTGKISVEYRIQTPERLIRPLKREEIGYIPFEFTSEEIQEWNSTVFQKEELLDGILEVVQQYADMPLRDQILLTGDVFLTYCLEWTSTVHFLFFVGDRGSGKTNATRIPAELGYRCMSTAQMSHANIYNFLGTDEEGVGCICEDEAQYIDRDKLKMAIYKSAYAKGQKIPKMDMFGKKVQLYYYTYCMVFFSGEWLPEDQALRERMVVIYMMKGNPKDNIKRPKDKEWKEDHVSPLRKKLLLCKLQNIGKEFPIIDSGLTGRDQELFEDFLSVFAGTKYEREARDVVDGYVSQRQQAITDSFEATIFSVLKPYLEKNKEMEFLYIMDILARELSGEQDPYSKTYVLDNDTRLTKNLVSKTLTEKFRAIKKPTSKVVDGKKKRTMFYVFDEKTIRVLSEKYHTDDPL